MGAGGPSRCTRADRDGRRRRVVPISRADSSLADYDEKSTSPVKQRVLTFLQELS